MSDAQVDAAGREVIAISKEAFHEDISTQAITFEPKTRYGIAYKAYWTKRGKALAKFNSRTRQLMSFHDMFQGEMIGTEM